MTERERSASEQTGQQQTGRQQTGRQQVDHVERTPAGRAWPATAEGLMRSRFDAFRCADAEWLLASWHPSTRPRTIDLSDNPRWRGLQIVDVVDGDEDDSTGIVEFRATYVTAPGEVRIQHERSTFVREDGRWFYVSAVSRRVGTTRTTPEGEGGRDA